MLSTKRAARKRRDRSDGRGNRYGEAFKISQRPAEVEDRAVPGHWEGDLVRHEALCNRAEVKDLCRRVVAAA
jgi:IS30 family transposase